jgi:hypothetical protein
MLSSSRRMLPRRPPRAILASSGTYLDSLRPDYVIELRGDTAGA